MHRIGQASVSVVSRFLMAGVFFAASSIQAADIIEGFDSVSGLTSKGWVFRNLSNPLGTTGWYQGLDASQSAFDAQAGPPTSYMAADFFNTGDVGTISNWAITPTNTYQDGDTISFWTRTITGSDFADRLEVRLSTNGGSSDVGNTALSVGDFTTLLLEINPTLQPTGYPDTWTEFVITLSGLGGPTSGRVAFRYFVTDAGAEATNANYIGIDTLRISTVPEPSTYALAAMSVTILGIAGRRARNRNRNCPAA